MTIYEQDTCTRADQSGWGTASNGDSWTVRANGNQTYAIATNEATTTYVNSTNLAVVTLGASTPSDLVETFRVQIQGTSDIGGLILRVADGSHYYYCDIGNVAGQLEIGKNVAGSFTSLATGTFSYAGGTYYQMKFQAQGTTLSGKIWADGSGEPGGWTVTVTDSAFASGLVGVFFAPTSGHVDKFDNFLAQSIPSGTKLRIFDGLGGCFS